MRWHRHGIGANHLITNVRLSVGFALCQIKWPGAHINIGMLSCQLSNVTLQFIPNVTIETDTDLQMGIYILQSPRSIEI